MGFRGILEPSRNFFNPTPNFFVYFSSKLSNVGIILFVRGCYNSKKKKKFGGGWENCGEGSKTPRKPKNSMVLGGIDFRGD